MPFHLDIPSLLQTQWITFSSGSRWNKEQFILRAGTRILLTKAQSILEYTLWATWNGEQHASRMGTFGACWWHSKLLCNSFFFSEGGGREGSKKEPSEETLRQRKAGVGELRDQTPGWSPAEGRDAFLLSAMWTNFITSHKSLIESTFWTPMWVEFFGEIEERTDVTFIVGQRQQNGSLAANMIITSVTWGSQNSGEGH